VLYQGFPNALESVIGKGQAVDKRRGEFGGFRKETYNSALQDAEGK
jgi:hypothetical protein